MDWFRVESTIYDHPKLVLLSGNAFRSLIHCWAFSARHETGGEIPQVSAKMLGLTKRVADELVDAGLLIRTDKGFSVHEWEEHQHDAYLLERRRRKDAQRQAEWRRNRDSHSDGSVDSHSHASADSPETEEKRKKRREEKDARVTRANPPLSSGRALTPAEIRAMGEAR